MKFEDLPSHIRTRWESAKVLNDGKRFVSKLLPFGRGGSSYEELTHDEFTKKSIEQINSNSKGYYLAWEVARLVADSLAWIEKDEQSLLLDISTAIKNRELAVQENIPGNSSLLKSWESYQSSSHYLRAESVNDWLLNKGVKFRLPDGEPDHPHLPAGAPIEGCTLKGCNLTEPVYWNPLPLAAACVAAKKGTPMDARGLVDLVAKRGKAGTATQTIIKAVAPQNARFCLVAMPGHPERIELLDSAEHTRLTSEFGRLPGGLAYIKEVRLHVIPLVANHLLELLLRGQTEVCMEFTSREDECIFLMPFNGGRHIATIETCGINQRDLLSLMDSLACEAKPAAPVVKETPDERRARWLAMFEAEQRRESRGALQRVADTENVDRSNMSKGIQKARAARDAERRAGAWNSQLVQDGKRKG